MSFLIRFPDGYLKEYGEDVNHEKGVEGIWSSVCFSQEDAMTFDSRTIAITVALRVGCEAQVVPKGGNATFVIRRGKRK